ncbi:MAG: hypothetical protein LBG87_06305 [Spirochaetaceae bacterium]|jgi:tetratricopeptide (TPR) repeat protein|nr:hypothetical protein [Spirochaetaceae bacterium]
MRRYILGLFLFWAVLFFSAAQTKSSVQTQIPPGMTLVTSQYYEVLSDSGTADAQQLANELDSRFLLYNVFFHFNPQHIGGARLKARAFKDQSAYNAYVAERLDKTSPGAVYLHYPQSERRELVINRGGPEEGKMFPHQAFVQFLRAFVPNPPSWLREGFAIYYSAVRYEAGQSAGGRITAAGLAYEENLSWLETVRNLGNKAPPMEAILLADNRNSFPDNFQGVSWALVSFLKDGGKGDYLRFLYESFIMMKDSVTAQDNSEILYNHLKSWTDLSTLDRDYKAYLLTRKTFFELITEGQRAYSARDSRNAEAIFQKALQQRPSHYAPYYYLGLLAYDAKNYNQAEQYYLFAQQYGADPALIAYAMGINAAAAGNNAKAIVYLEQAKAVSPAQYNDQVDNLIKRLR